MAEAQELGLDGKYRIESWPRQFISRQGAKHNTSQLWLIYKNSSAGAFSQSLYCCFLNKAFIFSLFLKASSGKTCIILKVTVNHANVYKVMPTRFPILGPSGPLRPCFPRIKVPSPVVNMVNIIDLILNIQ